MPIAIRRGVSFPYVLERERGNGVHTTFFLRPLSLAEENELMAENPEGPAGQRLFMDKICRLGITAWENWCFADGQSVDAAQHPDPVELLIPQDRGEIALAIMGTERAAVEKSVS